jgi:protein-S-isoprenylcysteine O-methyltransferase Ste14
MQLWRTKLAILFVAAAGAAIATLRVRTVGWNGREIAGLAIATPGFCLWALARLQLGESFAARPKATALVTRGLYSKIQNPIYVFGAFIIAGVIVFSGQPIFLLVFLGLIPVQLKRIRNERAVLEAKFGDEYRRYRESTWF